MPEQQPRRRSDLAILVMIFGGSALAVLVVLGAIAAGFLLMRKSAPVDAQLASEQAVDAQPIVPAPPAAQLSDDELTAYAAEIESVAANQDLAAAGNLIDVGLFTDTIFSGMDTSTGEMRNFRVGMSSRVGEIMSAILSQAGAGATYKFLRIRQVDGRPRLLFRLKHASGAINYHELLVDRPGGGEIKIADIYVYMSGELMSQTMRRMAMSANAQSNKSWIEKLSESDRAYVDNIEKLGEINQLVAAGKSAQALELYKSLPQSIKSLKPVGIVRINAAQDCGEAEYMAAMEDYRQSYPNDPALLLMEIDYYFLRKEHDKVLSAIDRLDQAIDGDPFLKQMRGGILIDAARWDEARTWLAKAIEQDPQNLDAYWQLIAVELKRSDFAAVKETLQRIDQTFTMEWSDLTQSPEYAEFVKAPEYAAWLQYLRDKATAAAPTPTPPPETAE